MSEETLSGCIGCVGMLWPFFMLLATYFIGSFMEKKHMTDILAREEQYRSFPVLTFETVPESWNVHQVTLVQGSVVISVDYFKRFLAALRGLVGGRIKSYEPLLDRARREAILRMIEDARSRGYNGILNARLETSRLASSRGDSKGIAGVEMLAFGTAVKLG
jgi:uncharacterized protein YbjQ (UPF0145 family)